ncbi:hypothetical protein FEM48_Zijuj02G0181700 [Ziziphus jujuba var. spinosa]|uniref:Subtilisin-like protease fibronectin type-III domain-containing protein n=1 Tax=Ziziphus jujuba var. spinosa TaxID=714518 RepID=A0A978VX72_ZIZJJ|nr:hypothetical protein FEM48_Zijuj02G0181700 [Ziziphus jujuba var. spinosa]
MMTTANPLDNTHNPIRDNGNHFEFASPLAIGSGHIYSNRALDPDSASQYKARVATPAGSEVIVSPDTLVFGKKNEKQRYSLIIKYGSDEQGKESFGEIVWVEENGNRTMRSPIVVSPVI